MMILDLSPVKKNEFSTIYFKMCYQKMLHGLMTLNLARFLLKDTLSMVEGASSIEDNINGKEAKGLHMQKICLE